MDSSQRGVPPWPRNPHEFLIPYAVIFYMMKPESSNHLQGCQKLGCAVLIADLITNEKYLTDDLTTNRNPI